MRAIRRRSTTRSRSTTPSSPGRRAIPSSRRRSASPSPDGSAERQADILRNMVEQKVDGLAVSVIDAGAARQVVDQAAALGIPTICWDSDCPGSQRKTCYSVNNEKLGAELAEQLL